MRTLKPAIAAIAVVTLVSSCLCQAQAAEAGRPAAVPPAQTAGGGDVAAAAESINDFAIAMYGELAGTKEGENLFFSPFSISTALAMTSAGARGETAAEIAQTLRFDLDQARLHPAMKQLIDGLNAEAGKGDVEMSVANALWGQQGFAFEKPFLTLTEDCYGAGLKQIDFAQSEAARKTINDWVAEKTKDKIQNLIPSGILDALTRLVLTNAIYFKGAWASPFMPKATQEEDFTLAGGGKTKAQMMRQKGSFGYAEWPDLQALEMPYKGQRLAMAVLLPRKADGLAELEKTLTPEALDGCLGKLTNEDVVVTFPKVKLTQAFSLAETLRSMGMKRAFGGDADFSGIDGKKDLFMSAVLHKAFVDITEEGTEAAAATGVAMRLKAEAVSRIITFKADHPFIFFIRDRQTRAILFMGRVANPGA